MTAAILAATEWVNPTIDWHAIAPEVILAGTIVLVLMVDLFTESHSKWLTAWLCGVGMLASAVPLLTLAVSDEGSRSMFGGAYVVDDFSLVMKGVFIAAGYLTVLLSTNYIAEGDYWEGEYYVLLASSVFGMAVMASSRDLISIFIALEMLSIPAYLLAGWRKRDLRGNEAGMKYYLMGVFASAVMLYGMSLIYGGTGSTILTTIGEQLQGDFGESPMAALGIVFVLVGFGFKISAVPFHNWAPDTYEGAPTPVTAFLSVASKAAGFVAIVELIFVAFRGQDEIYGPMMWGLAVLTMTVGNLIALKQTNIVRLFAYSSVAQAGFMLAPLAVAGQKAGADSQAVEALVTYLIIYTAMNLGAFAVIIAVARRTGSGEISSFAGLGQYAPGLAVAMSGFLFALAGIPPFGGWYAKFQVFRAVVAVGTPGGMLLGVAVGLNSVIALFYYANVARQMWMNDPVDGDRTPVRVPPALGAAVAITLVATLVSGALPGLVADLAQAAGDLVATVR